MTRILSSSLVLVVVAAAALSCTDAFTLPRTATITSTTASQQQHYYGRATTPTFLNSAPISDKETKSKLDDDESNDSNNANNDINIEGTIANTISISTTEGMPSMDEDFNPEGVICARGVCVVAEDTTAIPTEVCAMDETLGEVVCTVNPDAGVAVQPGLSFAYLWPRIILLLCSVLYGMNFPIGRIMNEALPASAATSARMLLAAVALSPCLLQLKPNLRTTAALCGCFTALGYITQSIALVDTPAATVSFLGALVVLVPPALSVTIDKRPMAFKDAPQTWIAAGLCLVGVGVLELGGGVDVETTTIGWGDFWSVLQAVGFGTSFFITERMMAKEPSQALPITAMQCGMSALLAGVWAVLDGTGAMDGLFSFDTVSHGAWLLESATATVRGGVDNAQLGVPPFTLPALFMDTEYRTVALAAVFTGFLTTAANRVGETKALGKLSSSEASVLLATEPLWAAVFATALIGEQLTIWDVLGGAIIIASCVATALDPTWLRTVFKIDMTADGAEANNADESPVKSAAAEDTFRP